MSAHVWKVQESSNVQSTRLCISLVFSACWNPGEVGSDASEGTDLFARWEQTGKELKLPTSYPYIYCQRKAWPRLEVGIHLKRSGLAAKASGSLWGWGQPGLYQKNPVSTTKTNKQTKPKNPPRKIWTKGCLPVSKIQIRSRSSCFKLSKNP